MLWGENPAKQLPKLLLARSTPWLGEGHTPSPEARLGVSQLYLPDCAHHPTLTLHWGGPS